LLPQAQSVAAAVSVNCALRVDEYVNRIRIGPLRHADLEAQKQIGVEAINRAMRITIEAGK
jgi:hypothetical protein